MSGKTARRRRKAAAAPPPPVQRKGRGGRRRASTRVLVAAAIAAVAVVGGAAGLAVAFGGGSSGAANVPTVGSLANAPLPNAADAQREFARIPQQGNELGSPSAKATLVEYIDLQCPNCQAYEATVMPAIVRRFVRTGKLRVEARPIAFIGPDSVLGRDAAIAASRQNRMYQFMQVVYLNQGTENTGWLKKDFVLKAAASVPGMNVNAVDDALGSSDVGDQAKQFETQANTDQIPGTPALLVGKTGGKLTLVPTHDEATVAGAIERALR
jgi:protein-disulfide isomerase